MPQPTWQQVAAPDVSGALQGYAQFSKLMGDGLGSLKSAGEGFDQAKSNLINNQFAVALAQQPNTQAAQAAIASGRIGGIDLTDPNMIRRLSSANLQAISPDELIKQATNQAALTKTQRALDQNQVQDALAPQMAAAMAKVQSGDPAIRAQGHSELAALNYKGVGADFALNMTKDTQNTERNAISDAQSQFSLGTQQLSQNEQRDASTLAEEGTRKIASTSDIDNYITGLRRPDGTQLSGTEQSMVRGRMLELMNQAATTGGGGFAGPAVTNPESMGNGGYDTLFGSGKYVQPNKSISSMTLGELGDTQTSLINATKGKIGQGSNVGTSAAGMYQITKGTLEEFAPQVLGSNWKDRQFTPAVQEAIAQKIYESTKGDPKALQARWASLSPEQAQQISDQKMPWNQVRGIIARGEVGVDPLQLTAESTATDAAFRNAQMKLGAYSVAGGFSKVADDITSTAQDVAANLKKTTFTDGHLDNGRLVGLIQEIQAEGQKQGQPLTAAMAGEILKNSATNQGGLRRLLGGGMDGKNLGNGQVYDQNKASDLVNQIKTGKMGKDMATFAVLQQAQAPMMIANQRWQDALNRYNQAQKQAQTKQGMDPAQLEQYRQRYIQASLDRENAIMAGSKVPDKADFGQPNQPDKSKVQAALDQHTTPNFVGAY